MLFIGWERETSGGQLRSPMVEKPTPPRTSRMRYLGDRDVEQRSDLITKVRFCADPQCRCSVETPVCVQPHTPNLVSISAAPCVMFSIAHEDDLLVSCLMLCSLMLHRDTVSRRPRGIFRSYRCFTIVATKSLGFATAELAEFLREDAAWFGALQ